MVAVLLNRGIVRAGFILLAVFAPARGWFGYHIFYKDIVWSLDSRHIAFSLECCGDEVSSWPDEAVLLVSADDTNARPVMLTPPLDRIAVGPQRQAAAWSDQFGIFVIDIDQSRVVHHLPHLDEGAVVPRRDDEPAERWAVEPDISRLVWSPDGNGLAGTGYDNFSGYNQVLVTWDVRESLSVLLARDVVGFCWRDADTILYCGVPVRADDVPAAWYAAYARTGTGRPASRAEYESSRPKRTRASVLEDDSALLITADGTKSRRVRLPVAGQPGNPAVSPDNQHIALDVKHRDRSWLAVLNADGSSFKILAEGWAPQWLGKESLFFQHRQGFGVVCQDGSGLRVIPWPRNGHHPRWVADSIVEFRVGRWGADPPRFHENPPEPGEVPGAEYRYDELWQVNVVTGSMRPVPTERLAPVTHLGPHTQEPVLSHDGTWRAQIEDGRLVLTRADGRGERVLYLPRQFP